MKTGGAETLPLIISKEDFERYHFSQGWVFAGWVGWSKWIRKEFGEYREVEFLFEGDRLVRMTQQGFPPPTVMISVVFKAPSG